MSPNGPERPNMKKLFLLRTRHNHSLHSNLPARAIYSVLAMRTYLASKKGRQVKPTSQKKLGDWICLDRCNTVSPALHYLASLKLVTKTNQGWIANEPADTSIFYSRKSSGPNWYQNIAYDQVEINDEYGLKKSCSMSLLTRNPRFSNRTISRFLGIDHSTVGVARKILSAKKNITAAAHPAHPPKAVDLDKHIDSCVTKLIPHIEEQNPVAIKNKFDLLKLNLQKDNLKLMPSEIATIINTITKELVATKNRFIFVLFETFCEQDLEQACNYASGAKLKIGGAMLNQIRSAMGFYDDYINEHNRLPLTCYPSFGKGVPKKYLEIWKSNLK